MVEEPPFQAFPRRAPYCAIPCGVLQELIDQRQCMIGGAGRIRYAEHGTDGADSERLLIEHSSEAVLRRAGQHLVAFDQCEPALMVQRPRRLRLGCVERDECLSAEAAIEGRRCGRHEVLRRRPPAGTTLALAVSLSSCSSRTSSLIASAGAGSLASPDPARDSASMRFTASLLSAAASAAILVSPARSTCGTRRSSASMFLWSVAMISADVETAVVSLWFICPCSLWSAIGAGVAALVMAHVWSRYHAPGADPLRTAQPGSGWQSNAATGQTPSA